MNNNLNFLFGMYDSATDSIIVNISENLHKISSDMVTASLCAIP